MCRRRSNFPEQEKRGQRTRGEHLARVKHWARDFPRVASCAPIREADAITTPAEYEETEAQGGHAAPNGTPKSIYCLRLPPLPHPSAGGVGTTVLPISLSLLLQDTRAEQRERNGAPRDAAGDPVVISLEPGNKE